MLNKLLLVVSVVVVAPYFVNGYKVTVEKTANGFLIHPVDTKNTNIPSSRIIGGGQASPHYYIYQAALLIYKGKDTYFCGGTLLTNKWVLTAAHCLEMRPKLITVILGAHNLTDLEINKVQVYNATKYKHHSDFNGKTFENDVGLIMLDNIVTLNKYVNVAKVAGGTNDYVGRQGFILGWGQTETESSSFVLKQVISPIISNEDCANTNDDYKNIIKPTHICTSGEGPKGICGGDAGGPLLVDGVQVGIASFGPVNCSAGLPSVFSRETDFLQWIKDHITDGGFDDPGDDDDDDDDDGGPVTRSY